jgi:hypothetical protein
VILGWAVATWTQEDIDTLKAAIASGVLTVEYAGPPPRKLTYQNLREMRDLLAEMIGQVQSPARYRRAQFRKGFRDGC